MEGIDASHSKFLWNETRLGDEGKDELRGRGEEGDEGQRKIFSKRRKRKEKQRTSV